MKLTNNIPETMIPGSYAEFNYWAGPNGLPRNIQKVLLVGAGTGTMATDTPSEAYTEAQAESMAGAGSVLHAMYLAAKKAWKYAQITLLRHAEPEGGSAATWTITLATTATKTGRLVLRIGATIVSVSVLVGATPAAQATALAAAVNAKTSLPVTASATDGVVTLTAKNLGAYISAAGGVSVDVEADTTDMTIAVVKTAGVGVVDISNALASAFPERYHLIGVSVNDSANLGIFRTHLASAADAMEQRGQRGIAALHGSVTGAKTLVTGLNYERLHIGCVLDLVNPVWEIAASMCAVFASNSQPNKPMNGLALAGLSVPDVADRWSGEEQDALLYAGVIPLVGVDGELCMVRAVTTMSSKDGVRFEKLVDTGVIASLDYTRDALLAVQRTKYKNAVIHSMLADAINEDNIAVCRQLEEANIHRHVDANLDRFITQESTDVPGRMLCRVPAGIVPGLHQIYSTIDLYLN